MILRDLVLGLAQGRWNGKGLGDRLAVDLSRESEKGSVARIIFSMTVATRVAAATACGRNGASTHIAQSGNLPLNVGSLYFHFGQRVGHKEPPAT